MEIEINPEDLISLVHERVVLWDKTSNEYKNKQLKISAWREICCLLRPDFDKLDEKQRQHLGKIVSTKWSNLRDAWMRAKKNEEQKSGAGAKLSKPYVYKEQMRFLQKVAEPHRTHDSIRKRASSESSDTITNSETEESSQMPAKSLPSISKKQKTSQKTMDIDEKMCQFLDNRLQADHPMLSFFKGILPAVISFDNDETLELQSGLLSLIHSIKQKRENRLYSSTNTAWYTQSRNDIRGSGYSMHMLPSGGPEHYTQNQNIMFPTGGYLPQNQNIMFPTGGYSPQNQSTLPAGESKDLTQNQSTHPSDGSVAPPSLSPASSTWSQNSSST